MEYISSAESIDWKRLARKTIFITGGTGLIGSTVIDSLLYANNKYKLNVRIIALVRNLERAKGLFHSVNAGTSLSFIVGSVESLPEVQEKVDYIIHGASPTASLYFVQHQVKRSRLQLKEQRTFWSWPRRTRWKVFFTFTVWKCMDHR